MSWVGHWRTAWLRHRSRVCWMGIEVVIAKVTLLIIAIISSKNYFTDSLLNHIFGIVIVSPHFVSYKSQETAYFVRFLT
jgi:hypothetical protein